MDRAAPKTIFLRDYRPPPYRAERVHLDVRLDATATQVRARTLFRPASSLSLAGERPALVLDGSRLELESVLLSGRPLAAGDFEVSDRSLTIPLPSTAPFELEVTTICNPQANAALSGLYRSGSIYCTQCEPEGFRRITYFLDRPDVLAVYTTRIEADKDEAPVLLANGNPMEAGSVPSSNRHFAVWHDPYPKPSYLFAMVGGALGLVRDSFTTASGRKVDLRIYVEPGQEGRCAWAMESLKRAMRWDEERFGREYDLDVFMIVAVSDFNMGAMENKGLNIFNDKLILARPETATDADYAAIEAVIAHEYFHNWSGNRVTCRDWFQLCLKEGLTVFRDQEFTSDLRSGPVKRISDARMLRTHQFPEDNGPLAHPVRPDSYIEINNFYTATVYEKGAELCRMIQTILGRDGFRKGLDLYFERHDGTAATVEDFVAAMSDANGVDLKHFMAWYSQAGTPELACSLAYDPSSRTAELSISQATPPTPGQRRKKPLHIPFRLGLLGQNGDELPLRLESGEKVVDGLLHLRKREHVFRFRDIPSRPVPSLLRGFSAPVKLISNVDDRDLEFLMAHDGDPFNCWQAGQSNAVRILVEMVKAIRKGHRLPTAQPFAKALGASLRDDRLEPAFLAECLKMPSESDIARELARNVDPDAVHEARERLRAEIGREIHSDLLDAYAKFEVRGPYSPDADSAGRRALRNMALSLLAATGEKDDVARVARHYRAAGNMTDTMAALSVLAHLDDPSRDEAFEDFFAKWKHDHLVVDKWFSLQATSMLPDAVERVQALASHPLFSLKNPNKVRAVIGAFANLNPIGFNRRDGAGYVFVADKALEIDAFNPQIAARLLGAFKSWRLLEAVRRNKAKRALEKVAEHRGLSRDAYEIVTKTLEQS